jgi:CO/xanthine dehydrogenase FAD-binding subunit
MRHCRISPTRRSAASDFFEGALTTALRSDEMLMEVELRVAEPRSGSCFLEVSRRRGDFALLGVACIVQLGEDRECVEARIGLCNAGETPILADQAGKSLAGRIIDTAQIDAAADLVQKAIDPGGNVHASKEFQRHLAGVLTRQALIKANERALQRTSTA